MVPRDNSPGQLVLNYSSTPSQHPVLSLRGTSCHANSEVEETSYASREWSVTTHTHTRTHTLSPYSLSLYLTVEEALPVKPVQQRNIPVKAISTTARSPPEGEEEGVRGHQSNTLPRTRRSLGGGLRPPGGMSRPRNASAERASQRQYVESSLRSRSPSPGLRQTVNLHSRSPSPTLQPSTMATPPTRLSRLHQQSHVTPSHPHTSPGRHGISKSPSATGVRKLPTPPSSGGHRSGGRGLPPSSSAPSPGQRVAVSPGRQAAGLSPSSGFARPRQQQMGVVTTPPRVGGARQRVQRSPQRGVAQPSPPRSVPSQSRTVRSSPPRSHNHIHTFTLYIYTHPHNQKHTNQVLSLSTAVK